VANGWGQVFSTTGARYKVVIPIEIESGPGGPGGPGLFGDMPVLMKDKAGTIEEEMDLSELNR
jgi:hypothetical protein